MNVRGLLALTAASSICQASKTGVGEETLTSSRQLLQLDSHFARASQKPAADRYSYTAWPISIHSLDLLLGSEPFPFLS